MDQPTKTNEILVKIVARELPTEGRKDLVDMRYLKLFLNRPRYLVLLLLLKTLGQKLRYPSVAVLVTIAAVSYALWHKKMIPSPVP